MKLITAQPLVGTDWRCDPDRGALTASRFWFIDQRHEQKPHLGPTPISNPVGRGGKRRREEERRRDIYFGNERAAGAKRRKGGRSSASPPHAVCQQASWRWLKLCTNPKHDFSFFFYPVDLFFFFWKHLLLCWKIGYRVAGMYRFQWKSSAEGAAGENWPEFKTLMQTETMPRLFAACGSGNREEVSRPEWRSDGVHEQLEKMQKK